jgi:penicillin amidase
MQKQSKFSTRGVLCMLLLAGLLLAALCASWAYWQLRASLPTLDGVVALAELDEEVSVTRDEVGMVTLSANSRTAVARAMGFVHAQERFFQMDLMRRQAAGELSALFGGMALEADKGVRIHQLRARARAIVAGLASDESEILLAYVAGVNEGLHRLASKPFEYWVLRAEPVDWTAEDTHTDGVLDVPGPAAVHSREEADPAEREGTGSRVALCFRARQRQRVGRATMG